PSDECTFWYTNAYVPAGNGLLDWHTRIGAFRLPACPPQYAVSLPASATPGEPVSVTVTARDALGNTLAAYAGPATLASDDGGAAFGPGAGVFTNGASTFTATFSTPGAHRLTVVDPFSPNLHATAQTAVAVAGAPGPAARIAAVSGDGQVGTVGTDLALPLVVRVTDASGNGVAGVAVAFAAPAGGGVAPSSALTAADGTASTRCTLGTVAGAEAFTAAASGL